MVAVGSDAAGVNLKSSIGDQPREDARVRDVLDFGVAEEGGKTAYPIVCIKAAVARGEADRAVLFGGTGPGEAISANKVKGIRAVVAPELAGRIVKQWLGYEFDESSPSARKVDLITEHEERGCLET